MKSFIANLFKRRKKLRRRENQQRQNRTPHQFEQLEDRRLLAAVGLDNGNLVITDTGGNTNDDWSLGLSSGSLVISDANQNITLGAGLVGSGDGTPSVTIDPTANPGFTGHIVFNTLDGSDTLTVDSSGGSFTRDLVVNSDYRVTINGSVALSNQNFSVTAVNIILNGAIDTGGGDVSLSSISFANVNGPISAGSGAISISSRALDLQGMLDGTGPLVLKPSDPASAIHVGGVPSGFQGLILSDQDLANLTDGFSSITIGDMANGTGTVSLAGATFTDPVIIAGGDTNDTLGIDVTAPSVTLAGNVSPNQAADGLSVAGDLVLDDGSTFASIFSASTDGTNTTIQQGAEQAYPGESHPDFYHITFVTLSGSSPLFTSNPGANAVERTAWQVTYKAFLVGMVPGWNGVDATWRPFMSMSGINAKDHIDIQGPIFNTHGELVASDANTFFNGGAGNLTNPIKYDLAGGEPAPGIPVFSGTQGGFETGADCSNWESGVGSFSSVSYSTTTLYDNSGGACSSSGAIIGISPPIAWPTNSFGRIDVTGGVTIGDGVTLDLDAAALAGSTIVDGDEHVLINNDGTDVISGTFDGLPEGTTVVADVNGFDLRISYAGGSDSNDVVLLATSPSPLSVTVDSLAVIVNEGAIANNSGLFSAGSAGDQVVVSASTGVISQDAGSSGSWNWSFDATDDLATTQVTISADNGSGEVATLTFDLTVDNIAPTVTLNSVAAINENDFATLTGNINDPGSLDTFTLDVDWNDGSAVESFNFAAGTDSHTYAAASFDVADWDETIRVFGPGASFVASEVATGGNSGSFRQLDLQLDEPAAGATNGATLVNINPGLVYNPATQGPIDGLDFSIDVNRLQDPRLDNRVGIAIRQAGNTYQASGTNIFHKDFWQTKSWTGLQESDFSLVGVLGVPPDFSASGSPLEFGFYTSAHLPAGSPASLHSAGFDNVQITAHSTVQTFSISHQYLDDNPAEASSDVYTIGVTVTDDDAGTGTDAATVVVHNVAPTATISGPDLLVAGESADYGFFAQDVDADMWSFDYVVDWDDGSPVENYAVNGLDVPLVAHTFKSIGEYTVQFTATDKDGATSPVATLPVAVLQMREAVSETDLTKKTLKIAAKRRVEREVAKVLVEKGSVEVLLNDEPPVVFTNPDIIEIIVYGQDGDDEIRIAPDLSLDGGVTFLSTQLYGGGGDDILQGGSGENLIVGGDGNDELIGGIGMNVLEGGDGDDLLQDGGGTNTVIGGSGDNTFVPGDGTSTFEAEPGSTTPEVFADAYEVDEDGLLTVPVVAGLLANDLDPSSGVLSALLVSGPTHGLLALDPDGAFTYLPDLNYQGPDSFTYRASNATNESSVASVSIQVDNLVDLSGRVFGDLNNDGLFNGSDAGLGGVTVELFNETNLSTPLATETTDAEGRYTFDANLLPGQYRIVETQPVGLLDGDETAGDLGGTVDNAQDSNAISNIIVASGDPDADGYNFANIQPSRIQGLVWEDFNNDGEVNFSEKAIEGVALALSGTDDRGQAVLEFMDTDAQGIFEFINLRPSDADGYTLTEAQPAGFVDGEETPGTVNGVLSGSAADNVFSQIGMTVPGSDAMDYNFGERPEAGGTVQSGQAATIGFWQNKNGQNLVKALNGGESSTQLSNWLSTTFPNMYGASAGPNDLTGLTNAEVGGVFKALFKRNRKTAAADGPPKLDAQVMATALAVYVTNQSLAGMTAADFGFLVTEHGIGTSTFNIEDNGAAFNVADNTDLTVMDILLKTDERTSDGLLFDLNHDDTIDDFELTLRVMANLVYTDINEQGDI